MILKLFHGRRHLSEDLPDWGPVGPVLKGVEYVHLTYMSTITVGFESIAAVEEARLATGWENWDTRVLEMSIKENMVEILQLLNSATK